MNSEPVAYVRSMCNDYINWKIDPMKIDGQPLYTHSTKTLTDEEINTEMLAYLNSKTMGLEDFARAILRKAQEK